MKSKSHVVSQNLSRVGILLSALYTGLLAFGQGNHTGRAMAGADFDLSRHTVDGGGVMHSTGGDFELSGTIGQPDAGVMTRDDFTLSGGFWFGLTPTDCNEDGGVTLLDYSAFRSCLAGPNAGVPAGCDCFDVNRSGTVDLLDFSVVQKAFTGS